MEILSNSDVCVALVGQTNRSLVSASIPAKGYYGFRCGAELFPSLCSELRRTWSNTAQNKQNKQNTAKTHNKIRENQRKSMINIFEYSFGICYASYATSYALCAPLQIPIMPPTPSQPPMHQTPTQSHSTAQNNKTINFRILHRHHPGPRGSLRNSGS